MSVRPTMMLRLRRHIGFLALFTVLTSTSLNCVTLIRERREERRLHQLQCVMLDQLHDSLVRAPSSSQITLDEQRQLVRRVRALRIDPRRLGIAQAALPSLEEEDRARRIRDAQTGWGKALFGSGIVGKMREAMGKTMDTLLGRDPSSFESSSTSDSITEEEAEYIRAFEEAVNAEQAESTSRSESTADQDSTATAETSSMGASDGNRSGFGALASLPTRGGRQSDAENSVFKQKEQPSSAQAVPVEQGRRRIII